MEAKREDDNGAPCSHHWVIDSANGPISRGVCRLCQEVREFENSPNIQLWGNGPTSKHPTRQSGDDRA